MGLFNLIETFFFISLGITFVLILLLVYHFKQRIISLEKKSDTMFEIINNIVKEITFLRASINTSISFQPNRISPEPTPVSNYFMRQQEDEDDDETTNNEPCSDDEEDDDEDDEDDEDKDDDEEEEEEDDEEEPDEKEGIIMVKEEEDLVNVTDNYQPEENNTSEDAVKVINVENLEQIDSEIMIEPILEVESDTDGIVEINEVDPIHVEKLETTNEEEHLDETSSTQDINKEIYRKMNLNTLKALVITKGLCSDSSKLKKPELLKMLETNNE